MDTNNKIILGLITIGTTGLVILKGYLGTDSISIKSGVDGVKDTDKQFKERFKKYKQRKYKIIKEDEA